MLAENQKDMSDRFARSGVNKWEGTTYAEGLFGGPALPGVAAVLECAAWATHAAGDHVLFIAEVRRFRAHLGAAPAGVQQGTIRQAARNRVHRLALAARHPLLKADDDVQDRITTCAVAE